MVSEDREAHALTQPVILDISVFLSGRYISFWKIRAHHQDPRSCIRNPMETGRKVNKIVPEEHEQNHF